MVTIDGRDIYDIYNAICINKKHYTYNEELVRKLGVDLHDFNFDKGDV